MARIPLNPGSAPNEATPLTVTRPRQIKSATASTIPGVVVGVANPRHRHRCHDLRKALNVLGARVLDAAVGVVDQALRWRATHDRPVKRCQRQFGCDLIGEAPSDTATGEGIQEHGQITKTRRQPDVGDVSNPDLVAADRTPSLDPVRIGRVPMVAVGGGNEGCIASRSSVPIALKRSSVDTLASAYSGASSTSGSYSSSVSLSAMNCSRAMLALRHAVRHRRGGNRF